MTISQSFNRCLCALQPLSPSLHLLGKMNTTLGKIAELKDCDRGYSRLTLTINKPFETKLLKFNVWKKNLLRRESGENFEVGDEVSVNYHFKGSFPTLDAMTLTPIDHCPICGNALEQINTLRMDCVGCAFVPETERKQLIHENMKLVSFSAEQYQYSVGYRLELLENNAQKPHVCIIFPNKLIYNSVPNLKIGQSYLISAWKNENFLDVIEIC